MPRWEIPYHGDLLALHGPVRDAVGMYMIQEGIDQPQAVAELIMAGHSKLVSTPLPPKSNLDGPTPMQRRMGRVHLENRDNERESGTGDRQVHQ